MAPLDTTITTGQTNHQPDHEALHEFFNAHFTPEAYGAVGDGSTDDTTALQNAINDANARSGGASGITGAGGVVLLRSGATYRTTSPLTWKHGVAIVGQQGKFSLAGSPPVIAYDGADVSGTGTGVLQFSGTGQNVQFCPIINVGVGGLTTGVFKIDHCIKFPAGQPKVDFGSVVHGCAFGNVSSHALSYESGITNLHISDCRWDHVKGYAIYAKWDGTGKGPDFITVDKFTYDNQQSGTAVAPGFMHLDWGACTDVNALGSRVRLSSAKVEFNVEMKWNDGTNQGALVVVTAPSAANELGNRIVAHIEIDNMWIIGPVARMNEHSVVILRRPDGTLVGQDYVQIAARHLDPRTWKLVTGTATAGPTNATTGPRRIQEWVFSPFNGSPAGARGLVLFQGPGVNLGNVPSTPETPQVGGVLYVEAGALKYRGSSGTISTLANA